MKSERIQYIDRLKGFAIFCVIVGHLTINPLGHKDFDIIRTIVGTFHVPLLFFLSGFVISEPPTLRKLLRKILQFGMPMITIGLTFTYLAGYNVITFVEDGYKLGYWYLYVLCFFYVILFFFRWFKMRSIWLDMTFGFLSFVIIYILYRISSYFWGGVFSLSLCNLYWPLFFTGYIIRKYNIGDYIFNKNWIYSLSLIGYVLCSYLYIEGNEQLFRLIIILSPFFLLPLFKYRENCDSFIDRELAKFGRNSLNLYIYQYLIIWTGLISLQNFGVFLKITNNVLIEFVLLGFMAYLVGYLCIFLGFILKKSSFLKFLIYGDYS
jgi:putative membrane protein